MFSILDNLARRLIRRGVRQGILEGNPVWVAVLAVALLVRLVSRPQRPQVIRETLRLGETITVSHVAPDARNRTSSDS